MMMSNYYSSRTIINGNKCETTSDHHDNYSCSNNNNDDDDDDELFMNSKKKKNKFVGSAAAKRGRYEEDNNKKLKLKGVVAQQNGHWGAQIYAKQQRIWLGTFKSEREAAMAYYSAAIKLRGDNRHDHHRNHETAAVEEAVFQSHYSTEAVLAMIRDGSYPSKLATFLSSTQKKAGAAVDDDDNNKNSIAARRRVVIGGNGSEQLMMRVEAELLFRKELTPSDVGKLNRLVVPKKHALAYFPPAPAAADDDDVEVVFYDRLMRSWKFRYCYWKSSQSFVFTRGWNRFVKFNNLKPKDIIAFYFCDPTNNNMGAQPPFSLIDVIYTTAAQEDDEHEYDDEMMTHPKQIIMSSSSEVRVDQDRNTIMDLMNDDAPKGLRLFGVSIN